MYSGQIITLEAAWDDFYQWWLKEVAAGRLPADKQVYESEAARRGRRKYPLGAKRAFRFFELYRPGYYSLIEAVVVVG